MTAQGISEDEIKPTHKDFSENKEIPRASTGWFVVPQGRFELPTTRFQTCT